MNKEHFLIELKIYLKPIATQDQAIILEKYNAIFKERMEQGATEEEVAKSLGKPREIAEKILATQNIKMPEKKIENDGWQEIEPATVSAVDVYDYFQLETPYDDPSQYTYRPLHSPFVRFLQVLGIVCLNLFCMIWVIGGIFMFLAICTLIGAVVLLSPIVGIYGVFNYFGQIALFQLFLTIFLFGAAIIGWMLFIPILKFCGQAFLYYVRWNKAVLKGEI
ncbi:DUF1700 domain-containing protein [Enterococcus faecalis]